MTVKELIECLETMPQNAIVVAESYEEGFDTVKKVMPVAVKQNPVKEWYLGEYLESKESEAQQMVLLYAATKADKE